MQEKQFIEIFSLLGEVVMTTPTIGTNVEEVNYKNTKFIMWDMGGQESLRAKWSTYYTDTQVGDKEGSMERSVIL